MGAHAEICMVSGLVFRHACSLCALRNWCWPRGLDERGLKQLHAIVRQTGTLPARQHLFRANDDFTALYAVRKGCIKTYTTDRGGHEYVHGFHLPGELLGFDATYPEPHRFNALTLRESSLCTISYRDIGRLSREYPGLHSRILALMSLEFSRQQACTEGIGATQRFANFLFDVEARLRRQHDAGHEFDLPMSREDIANYLRFSAETMSRVITKLQQAAIISANRKHIQLLDVARLGSIAQGLHWQRKPDREKHDETQDH